MTIAWKPGPNGNEVLYRASVGRLELVPAGNGMYKLKGLDVVAYGSFFVSQPMSMDKARKWAEDMEGKREGQP